MDRCDPPVALTSSSDHLGWRHMCVLAPLLSLHSACACMSNICQNHLMAFLSHMWKDVAVCQRLRQSKSGSRAEQGCVYGGWAYMCHSCHACSNYRHWSTSKGFVLPVFYNKAPLPSLHCVRDTHMKHYQNDWHGLRNSNPFFLFLSHTQIHTFLIHRMCQGRESNVFGVSEFKQNVERSYEGLTERWRRGRGRGYTTKEKKK